jgi:hypothetical protein
MLRSRELVGEETIIRAIVFGFINVAPTSGPGVTVLNCDVFWPTCHNSTCITKHKCL